MWITNNIAARTFIWLAVATIPVQQIPADFCGCPGDKGSCQQGQRSTGCCHGAHHAPNAVAFCPQPATGASCSISNGFSRAFGSLAVQKVRSSCRIGSETGSCCSSRQAVNPGCQCTASCRCKQSSGPVVPSAPLLEELSEELLTDWLSGVSFTMRLPHARSVVGTTRAYAIGALDRCAILCRFAC